MWILVAVFTHISERNFVEHWERKEVIKMRYVDECLSESLPDFDNKTTAFDLRDLADYFDYLNSKLDDLAREYTRLNNTYKTHSRDDFNYYQCLLMNLVKLYQTTNDYRVHKGIKPIMQAISKSEYNQQLLQVISKMQA